MNDIAKNLLVWLLIAGGLMFAFGNFNKAKPAQAMSYSEFLSAVDAGEIKQVRITPDNISGDRSGGQRFDVVRPPIADPDLMNQLLKQNVAIVGAAAEQQGLVSQLLVAAFPILLMVGLFMFLSRKMGGGMGGGPGGRGNPMSFGKSRARQLTEDQIKVTFADVAGCDEAKEEVKEVVEFLRDPGKFQQLGGRIPRGILMAGQPGTGKTLLAKAIAGEAKVPFFSISGSDFVEMFVGVGASRVRDMFEEAKKQSPCIIFIDEIDAVGRHRGAGMGGGNDEREQTLNQLLVEMDGFEGNEGVIVIAATNRPDVLDSALLRPGRFDRQVVVGLPDIRGREQILRVHMRKIPMSGDVDASTLARSTPGFSGADLANLVNEAALFAARGDLKHVSMNDFEKAKDKIMMGAERKSMVMSDKEKLNTAYHEAGHAIVGRLTPEHDPVYKVSIIPRGRALGVTMFLPEEDRYSISKRGIEGNICSLFGGRIAEELTLGTDGVTTGASNDIQRATELARNMVTKWGLSEKLGPLLYEENEGESYGRPGPRSNISSQTAIDIDLEMRSIIDRCYDRSRQLLVDNRDILDSMAKALMQYETIDADQIDDLMARREVRTPRGWSDSDKSGGTPAPVAADVPASNLGTPAPDAV
ncbi:MAG: ATP-dependent zinc metalloprotease FtsH [Pseudomonadota bacterium]